MSKNKIVHRLDFIDIPHQDEKKFLKLVQPHLILNSTSQKWRSKAKKKKENNKFCHIALRYQTHKVDVFSSNLVRPKTKMKEQKDDDKEEKKKNLCFSTLAAFISISFQLVTKAICLYTHFLLCPIDFLFNFTFAPYFLQCWLAGWLAGMTCVCIWEANLWLVVLNLDIVFKWTEVK